MAEIHFTSWLKQRAPEGPLTAGGGTVGEALFQVFTQHPQLRGYVLDDRGRLRKHVCVFADGARLTNDAALGHAIGPRTRLHVMQALSGG